MPQRLRPVEVSLLAMESAATPMHVATLDVFEAPADGLDYERLIALIGDRIAYVPRFRQRVQLLPGRLLSPVWVDDDRFDMTFHVRRSALPRPGSPEQLRELTARVMSRRLDRNRPLWETYLVEGLEGGRHAVLTKSHLALVDEGAVDLGQLILDDTAAGPTTPDVGWEPQRSRSPVELVASAVLGAVQDPATVVEEAQGQLRATRRLAERVFAGVEQVMGRESTPPGPLGVRPCEQRRFAAMDTPLASYRTIRRRLGGSVHDAVLATVAGGMRSWLLTRAEPVSTGSNVRALVPVSVLDDELAEPTALGSRVTAHLLDLPVGEGSPTMRLHQVSHAFKVHRETGQAVSADQLTEIAGFAPSTFHALGARLAATRPARSYELLVTNVPGPQLPLYAAGARMTASYPVLPLPAGQAIAIGVTSYDGHVFYGIDADRDAVPDIDVLVSCLAEALDELLDAAADATDRSDEVGP